MMKGYRVQPSITIDYYEGNDRVTRFVSPKRSHRRACFLHPLSYDDCLLAKVYETKTSEIWQQENKNSFWMFFETTQLYLYARHHFAVVAGTISRTRSTQHYYYDHVVTYRCKGSLYSQVIDYILTYSPDEVCHYPSFA